MIKECDVCIWGEKIGKIIETKTQIAYKYTSTQYNISPKNLEFVLNKPQTFSELPFFDYLPGVIGEALPGGFGNERLEKYFSSLKIEPTTLDKLLLIGKRGIGALYFEPSTHVPDEEKEIILQAEEVIQNDKKAEEEIIPKDLFSYMVETSSLGGMHKKAKLLYNKDKKFFKYSPNEIFDDGFAPCIVKLSEVDEKFRSRDMRIEYIWSLLAKKAGLEMPYTELLEIDHHRAVFIVERFDINKTNNDRLHLHSLAALHHFNYNLKYEMDYETIFRDIRELSTNRVEDTKRLFAQMVFNYVFTNQDDHAKNFSFLMDKNQNWSLSPAYDITHNLCRDHLLKINGKISSTVIKEDFIEIAERHEVKNYMDIIQRVESTIYELPSLLKEHYETGSNSTVYLEEVRSTEGIKPFEDRNPVNVWKKAKALITVEADVSTKNKYTISPFSSPKSQNNQSSQPPLTNQTHDLTD